VLYTNPFFTGFVRVYESGHEVPFYQPLLSLEIFERAINQLDIATGKHHPSASYLTEGTAKSEYREGNSTIQFDILPTNSTYNTSTGAPNVGRRAELLKRAGGLGAKRKRATPGALSHAGKRFKPSMAKTGGMK
jgi:hypothetical protein